MPDETDDAKRILTASPWSTGGDHQATLELHGWRLSGLKSNNLSLNEVIDMVRARKVRTRNTLRTWGWITKKILRQSYDKI